jgi:hypothetical protein
MKKSKNKSETTAGRSVNEGRNRIKAKSTDKRTKTQTTKAKPRQ